MELTNEWWSVKQEREEPRAMINACEAEPGTAASAYEPEAE